MARVPFKVSARAARLIGRENVATSQGAVTELVKNGYDADATVCAVLFLPRWSKTPEHFNQQEFEALRSNFPDVEKLLDQEGPVWKLKDRLETAERTELNRTLDRTLDLWIVDNGHGMSSEVINDQWMVIGTDAKEVQGRSVAGRVVTGAKGIGRFALDRLGRESELYSAKERATSTIHWIVDWSDFEGAGKIVSDVEAVLETENQLLSEVYERCRLSDVLPRFGPERNKKPERISFHRGTAIRIGLLYDAWDSADSLRLKTTLESLLPPAERSIFDIYVYDHRAPSESGFVENLPPEQFDYRMVASVREDGTVSISLERQEIDPAKIPPAVFNLEAMKRPGFSKSDFEIGVHKYETTLRRVLRLGDHEDIEPYTRIGPFEFVLYFFKLQNPTATNLLQYAQKNFDATSRRAWLSNSGGIRIFRDNFRVRPFGEPRSQSYDWLNLGQRVASNPVAASRVGWSAPPQQLAGTIHITKQDNPELDDQANREGIRNERAFRSFRVIVVALIAEFERDRSYIFQQFNAVFEKALNKDRATVSEARRIVSKYRRAANAEPSGENKSKPALGDETPKQVSSDIGKVGEALESQIHRNKILRDENVVLRGMATLGTILVSFTHELKQIKADMGARGDRLARAIDEVTDPSKLEQIPQQARPLSILDRMRRQDQKVSRWVDFALAAVSPKKRRRRAIDVYSYLEELTEYWGGFLADSNVKLHLDKRPSGNVTVMAHEIDLDSILYNLINNSVEAFLKPSSHQRREISIRTNTYTPHYVEIDYEDNGPGISSEFNVADDIFLFGITSKKEDTLGEREGTGIGMWLLRNVVEDNQGVVALRSRKGERGFRLSVHLPTYESGREAGLGSGDSN